MIFNLKGYTSSAATVYAQLLKNGVQVGSVKALPLPTVNSPIVFGGSNDTWGADLTTSNLNSMDFGVAIWVELMARLELRIWTL